MIPTQISRLSAVVAVLLALAAASTVASPRAIAQGREFLQKGRVPTLRGQGNNLEVLVRGRVLDVDGKPAQDFQLLVNAKKQHGRDALPTKIEGGQFEVWVPVGGSHWFYIELTANAKDGQSRAFDGIANRELRQAAIDGIDLELASTNRAVTVAVTHDGAPVANAHVNAELLGNMLLHGETDSEGTVTFQLIDGEKLRQLTAWTDDYRIGGFSFSRKPRRDPLGTKFTIELDGCRDQKIRFLDAANDSPIPNVPFELVIGTGEPNYNFAAIPDTFPHCRMTTDDKGEAICRWFPDWDTHGAYVEIVDPRWATALESNYLKSAEEGALLMKLKPRIPRKPIVGKVTSDRFNVGGLMVGIESFQGEEESRSDQVYAFTDEAGSFTADCIPGATYCVFVNDARLSSNMIDLIPYEPDTGKSNIAKLEVSEGNPIEIRTTSGSSRKPMQNQWVYFRTTHDYTWWKDGEERSGSGARSWGVYTDEDGIARAQALAGSEVRVSVNAGDWRSGERNVTVKEDGVTLVEFHRKLDAEREVKGRLLAPPNVDVELANAEIIYGSIDGETDEHRTIATDAQGRFAFRTKALQVGIFAYTSDGQAAGIVKPDDIDEAIVLQLNPTCDLHGQLLGNNDEPLGNHPVRVKAQVRGKRDSNKTFATGFTARAFETNTDGDGNYALKQLPSELKMTLRSAPIDGSDQDAYLDEFFLVVGEDRPRMVSRQDRRREPDKRSLSEKYVRDLRDAKLGGYHLLVMVFDSTSDDFVGRYLMDHRRTEEVVSFMHLRIREVDVADKEARQFVESQNWPQPERGMVFACALDGTGKELGRILMDTRRADVQVQAAEFIQKHAPPQADAKAKWDAAFAEADRSGRKVWARIGQRYCGPCFRLSRWLDDNRKMLEQDYVLMKIDNVQDTNGVDIANRIVSDREHFGVPFHAIFDAKEALLIDSEGPTGNIGHPTSLEGRLHLKEMLTKTSNALTNAEIEQIVSTLK